MKSKTLAERNVHNGIVRLEEIENKKLNKDTRKFEYSYKYKVRVLKKRFNDLFNCVEMYVKSVSVIDDRTEAIARYNESV